MVALTASSAYLKFASALANVSLMTCSAAIADDNMPLNPQLPFSVRLEVTAEDFPPIPVAMKRWTSAAGQLLCKLLMSSGSLADVLS